jgi:copper chaperone CopZ
MKSKFKVKGLDCANCAGELERAIQKVDGVEAVSINFLTQKMELEYDESQKEEIINKMCKVVKKEEPDVILEEI